MCRSYGADHSLRSGSINIGSLRDLTNEPTFFCDSAALLCRHIIEKLEAGEATR